ncbi:MAG: hypothetical protein L0H26_10365 [Microlunatus sp.]|nr:hypothetical protein [Microlunatus sp.]MDN5804967.1 hypothetical protein [Microlunatus sp.]
MGTTTLPTWAVYAVSFGTPILAFLGVLFGSWLTRRSARELETRSKREETMRTLRWGAELAASDKPGLADLGVAELVALSQSDLLDDSQKVFIDAALEAVVADPAEEIDEIEAAGDDVEVVEDPDD